MSVPYLADVSAWVALADASAEVREAEMRVCDEELASLAEQERILKLTVMAEAEYKLPDEKLRPFTRSRLMVWLSLPKDKALAVAHSYDEAMKRLPGPLAMRRVATVQTVTREFTSEQVLRLSELVPSVVPEVPKRIAEPTALPIKSPGPGPEKAKGRGWRFWKRAA